MAVDFDEVNPFTHKEGQSMTPAFDWIGGFVKSGIASIPEMIGITPSTETTAWRQDNPISAFVSEMAGMAVPYTGWFKATQAVGKFDKAVNALGVATKPFTQGVIQNAARYAPFEAGRLAVSQVVGDKDFSSMLGETAFNLAAGAGVGGIIHGIAAGGKRDPGLKSLFPNIDIAAPYTLQARHMREMVETGGATGEVLGNMKMKLAETLKQARLEELHPNEKYIGPLDNSFVSGVDKTDTLERNLNRMLRPRESTGDVQRLMTVKKFAVGESKDFRTKDEMKAAMDASGLGEGFEASGQFFRHVSFNETADRAKGALKVAKTIDDQLTKKMESVGGNGFMTREADEGMFVIAKKIEGTPGKADPTDKWTIFKTDQPGMFFPDADQWAKIQIAKSKWTPGADLAPEGGQVYNALRNFVQMFPLNNYKAMGTKPGKISETISKLTPKGMTGSDSELVARFGEAAKEYLVPRIHQFKDNFRANWIVNSTKVAYDAAENLTQELVNGVVRVTPGKNLWWQTLKNEKTGIEVPNPTKAAPKEGADITLEHLIPEGTTQLTPIREMVEKLDEKVFQDQFWKVWRDKLTPDQVTAMQLEGKISPEVAQFSRSMDAVDKYLTGHVSQAEAAVGKKPTEWGEGVYGLGRFWEGDARVLIKNDAGEIVGMVGGANKRTAKASAEKIAKENPGWKVEGEFSISQTKEVSAEVSPIVRAPSFLLESQNMRGFKFDTQAFTKQEFMDAIENAVRGKSKYMANISVDDVLSPSLERLVREDVAAYRMVGARMRDYAGVQSPFSQYQNAVVDKLLGSVMGPNSASKLVEYTNTALFNLQLGALKLSYPIVNALQFIQTVVPEAAFVLGSAPAERLAGRYSFFAAGGTKGPVGGMGVLSPIKMMGTSFREMSKPSPELSAAFQKAINDRVIDPRLVENYVGESRIGISQLGQVLKGEAGLVPWLRSVSEFLPAHTERMSRTHAFTTGFITARDFLKTRSGEALNPDQIYNFARQFTENTMYLYSAADKPRVFTTPAGSVLGLFKNWMMHFMGSMIEYSGEAVKHGNFAPLMWQTTGTFALGGLAATPLWWAADGFSRMTANKTALQMAYDNFGEKADGVMLGLPAALTGVSLYSSVNTPLSNPTRDASQLFSAVAWDRARSLGKVAGAAFDKWQTTGEHPARDNDVRDLLVKAFAPTTIYRSMAAATPGQITQMGTGYPQIKDVSTPHRMLYGFGFNPTEVDRGLAIAEDLYSAHQKMNAQVKKLGDAWADASIAQNGPQMAVIMRQATVWGVDVSKVIAEGMKGLGKHQKDIIERNLKPAEYGAYRGALAVQRGE